MLCLCGAEFKSRVTHMYKLKLELYSPERVNAKKHVVCDGFYQLISAVEQHLMEQHHKQSSLRKPGSSSCQWVDLSTKMRLVERCVLIQPISVQTKNKNNTQIIAQIHRIGSVRCFIPSPTTSNLVSDRDISE